MIYTAKLPDKSKMPDRPYHHITAIGNMVWTDMRR